VVSFLLSFPPISYMHSSFPPFVLYALLISFTLTRSFQLYLAKSTSYEALHYAIVTSSLFDPNILFRTLFSNIIMHKIGLYCIITSISCYTVEVMSSPCTSQLNVMQWHTRHEQAWLWSDKWGAAAPGSTDSHGSLNHNLSTAQGLYYIQSNGRTMNQELYGYILF
jgi:hypothetical protein